MAKHHLRELNGLAVLGKKHPVIRKIVTTRGKAKIHGGKVWGSSFLIMDYLREQPVPERTRIMELGADICFWETLVDPLYKAIGKAVKTGVEKIVIADPGRSPFSPWQAVANSGLEPTCWNGIFKNPQKLTVTFW